MFPVPNYVGGHKRGRLEDSKDGSMMSYKPTNTKTKYPTKDPVAQKRDQAIVNAFYEKRKENGLSRTMFYDFSAFIRDLHQYPDRLKNNATLISMIQKPGVKGLPMQASWASKMGEQLIGCYQMWSMERYKRVVEPIRKQYGGIEITSCFKFQDKTIHGIWSHPDGGIGYLRWAFVNWNLDDQPELYEAIKAYFTHEWEDIPIYG